MSGHHSLSIYSINDNPWCKGCLNGEKIVGTDLFKYGAFVCLCRGVPTGLGCANYQGKDAEEVK